jgi:hypothetical protein
MKSIPLHLQKRFEQRWAARFVRPVASATPKRIGLKETVNSVERTVVARTEKAKEKSSELSQRT